MSYCRWSTDDYRSDVYVYDGLAGWVTHVAGTRYVPCEPLPEPVDLPSTDLSDAQWLAWNDRRRAVTDIILRSDMVPIGGPYDGERFIDDDPASCLATLIMLAKAGYHVPDTALRELEEEAAW